MSVKVDILDVWLIADSLSDRKRILRESHLPDGATTDNTDVLFLGYELALRDLSDAIAELEVNYTEATPEESCEGCCGCKESED